MAPKDAKMFTTVLFLLFSQASMAQDVEEKPGMVKMCLFYPIESGHARSDPILNQECPSDHVHTFYGPKNFHPATSYTDLLNTPFNDSTSPWQENQSLYWHPSIYRVTGSNGQKTYARVNNLDTSPYYRWNSQTSPETVAFPPEFRMIAYSNQEGAGSGGETGGNLLVECCNFINGGENEDCTTTLGNPLIFPKKKCDFLGLAFAMPTCWDTSKGIGLNNPTEHVTYTEDGTVGGKCPDGYDKRIPQVQLFIRINKYKGGTYQLADGNTIFHVDFMNGWKEGALQDIIDKCEPIGDDEGSYNPPCNCDEFLTASDNVARSAVCDEDVRKYVIDEETTVVTELPRGTCQGADLIEKSWQSDPPFTCNNDNNDPPDDPDEDECADSELDFLFRGEMPHCKWVADNVKQRCKNKRVQSHCPQTCGKKKFCNKDSRLKFEIYDKDMVKNCKWVKKRKAQRCKEIDVCNTCRTTCANFENCVYFD